MSLYGFDLPPTLYSVELVRDIVGAQQERRPQAFLPDFPGSILTPGDLSRLQGLAGLDDPQFFSRALDALFSQGRTITETLSGAGQAIQGLWGAALSETSDILGNPFRLTGDTPPLNRNTGQSILLDLLRIARGLAVDIDPFRTDQERADAIVQQQGQLIPEQIAAVEAVVEQEAVTGIQETEGEITVEGPQKSPYLPSHPGQFPTGFNPNDPFLTGGSLDPAGIIDYRYAFPSANDLLEVIKKLCPDPSGAIDPRTGQPFGRCNPRDPAMWVPALKYWLGVAVRRAQQTMLDELQAKAAKLAAYQRQQRINAYLEFLQRWLKAWIAAGGPPGQTWQEYAEDQARAFGVDPILPRAAPDPCAPCGCKEKPCPSDKACPSCHPVETRSTRAA